MTTLTTPEILLIFSFVRFFLLTNSFFSESENNIASLSSTHAVPHSLKPLFEAWMSFSQHWVSHPRCTVCWRFIPLHVLLLLQTTFQIVKTHCGENFFTLHDWAEMDSYYFLCFYLADKKWILHFFLQSLTNIWFQQLSEWPKLENCYFLMVYLRYGR